MVWIVMGFLLIGLIDLRPLLAQRKLRAIAAFLVIFTLALVLTVLQKMNIKIPSAMFAWRDLLQWLGLTYPK